jgi:hypothetical protein
VNDEILNDKTDWFEFFSFYPFNSFISRLDLTAGEFDLLLPLRLEGIPRDNVFEVLKSSHIFYQFDYHDTVLAQAGPLWYVLLTRSDFSLICSYLQKHNESMIISDIPLVYKTGMNHFIEWLVC